MKTINERIRYLRKDIGLNQRDFGAQIGLKNGAISWIEKPGNTVIDQNIHLICDKFGVNEKWLRSGEGPIYEKASKKNDLMRWAEQLTSTSEDPFPCHFALALSRLGEREWAVLEKFIDEMIAIRQDALLTADQQEAARRAEAHRLLDLELDAEKKEPSASLDTACIEKNKKRA